MAPTKLPQLHLHPLLLRKWTYHTLRSDKKHVYANYCQKIVELGSLGQQIPSINLSQPCAHFPLRYIYSMREKVPGWCSPSNNFCSHAANKITRIRRIYSNLNFATCYIFFGWSAISTFPHSDLEPLCPTPKKWRIGKWYATQLTYHLSRASILIHDCTPQTIKRWSWRAKKAERHYSTWNGRNDSIRIAPL